MSRRSSAILGRRTHEEVDIGKIIRRQNGVELFEDYWTDSDSEDTAFSNSRTSADVSQILSQGRAEVPTQVEVTGNHVSPIRNITRKRKKRAETQENGVVGDLMQASVNNLDSRTKSMNERFDVSQSDGGNSEVATKVNSRQLHETDAGHDCISSTDLNKLAEENTESHIEEEVEDSDASNKRIARLGKTNGVIPTDQVSQEISGKTVIQSNELSKTVLSSLQSNSVFVEDVGKRRDTELAFECIPLPATASKIVSKNLYGTGSNSSQKSANVIHITATEIVQPPQTSRIPKRIPRSLKGNKATLSSRKYQTRNACAESINQQILEGSEEGESRPSQLNQTVVMSASWAEETSGKVRRAHDQSKLVESYVTLTKNKFFSSESGGDQRGLEHHADLVKKNSDGKMNESVRVATQEVEPGSPPRKYRTRQTARCNEEAEVDSPTSKIRNKPLDTSKTVRRSPRTGNSPRKISTPKSLRKQSDVERKVKTSKIFTPHEKNSKDQASCESLSSKAVGSQMAEKTRLGCTTLGDSGESTTTLNETVVLSHQTESDRRRKAAQEDASETTDVRKATEMCSVIKQTARKSFARPQISKESTRAANVQNKASVQAEKLHKNFSFEKIEEIPETETVATPRTARKSTVSCVAHQPQISTKDVDEKLSVAEKKGSAALKSTSETSSSVTKKKTKSRKRDRRKFEESISGGSVTNTDPNQYSECESAVRRSNRRRFPPLESWRNERALFRIANGTYEFVGIDEGGKDDSEWKRAVERKKKTDSPPSKKPVKTPTNVPLEGRIAIIDPETDEEIRANLISPYSSLTWKGPGGSPKKDSPFFVTKSYQFNDFSCGLIKMKPYGEKSLQYLPEHDVVFFISQGDIKVCIHSSHVVLHSKDTFIVPRGSPYSLSNISNKTAFLHFTMHRQSFLSDLIV